MKTTLIICVLVTVCGIQNAFAGGSVNDLTITNIYTGGYNDDNRIVTRIYVTPVIPTSTELCQFQNPVVIYSGIIPENSNTSGSTRANIIQTEYYQQQYSTALAALSSDKTIDVYVINGCTSDGKFPRVNRIGYSN